MKKAIYPGTFDPITNGHIDVIKRALKIFDGLVICVMINPNKKSLFSIEERMNMVRASVKDIDSRIEVSHFGGLLVDYVKKVGIFSVVRGLRALSDFEYEFQMALANRKLLPRMETVFLMTSEKYMYVTSSAVKEIAMFGGDVSCFVPQPVSKRLKEMYKKNEV
ncbi:MAG: pantetheine-phosphate adenylyltransferase [Thermotoga sp.]|nr:MAG: pantetheine-phosphate adenylyltransferase [Thermotoga sp.]